MHGGLALKRSPCRPKHRPYLSPQHAHWLTRRVFELLNEENANLAEVAHVSGVSRETIEDWRYRSNPTLKNIEAVVNTLGYDIAIRRKPKP